MRSARRYIVGRRIASGPVATVDALFRFAFIIATPGLNLRFFNVRARAVSACASTRKAIGQGGLVT